MVGRENKCAVVTHVASHLCQSVCRVDDVRINVSIKENGGGGGDGGAAGGVSDNVHASIKLDGQNAGGNRLVFYLLLLLLLIVCSSRL